VPEKKSCIIEFVQIGHQVKVTACDPDTGREVSIIGPSTATKKELTSLAMKKLHYMLNKP
jgi:hypothetical protein